MSIYSHRVFFNLITFFLLNSAVNQLAASEASSLAESEGPNRPASAASALSKGTVVHLEDGEWDTTPIRRGKRSYNTIKILNSFVKALDASCFQSDATLTTISFNGSSLDFTALVGYFGQGCPKLKTIDLTGTKDLSLPLRASQDITIERFVQIAHSDLLDLIVNDQTPLQILITKTVSDGTAFTMDEIRKSLLAILLEQKKQAARGILASVGGAVSGYLFSPRSTTTSASSGSPSIAPQAGQGEDENGELNEEEDEEDLSATAAAATPAALNALGESRRLPIADNSEDAVVVSGSTPVRDRSQEAVPLQAANSGDNSAVNATPLTSGATVAAGQGNGSTTQASSGPAATNSQKKKKKKQ